MLRVPHSRIEIRHFHLFCGLGGGARGFNRGRAEVGSLRAQFRCIGGVDVDAAAVRDFGRLAGVAGTRLDLFDREQYCDFHGMEPPATWREATPDDIRRAARNERPHIVFMSAPCKGFSGLLSETKSRGQRYQALNRLALRGIWLTLEAWSDDPPELIIFENVPRIATRGRALLDRIGELLRAYGYAVAETTHDCGEIGGLAQSRKRFLLVARHATKVPAFLYQPPRRALRAVGEILGRMPLPGDPVGGPMHLLPNLQWKTWVRLAFVEAGSDWRSLNKLRVVDGKLADYLIVPANWYAGVLGVTPWERPCCTVTGRADPTTGAFAVADPRFAGNDYHTYGVRKWEQPAETVTGKAAPGAGSFSVADPRMPESPLRQNGIYRIIRWDSASGSVTGASHVAGAALSVADPRPPSGPTFGKYAVTRWDERAGTVIGGDDSGAYAVSDPRAPGAFGGTGKYRVTPFNAPANTVIAQSTTGHGCFAVADPRLNLQREKGDDYLTAGHYGVVPWDAHCGAVSAAAGHDNGRWNVADPRIDSIPAQSDKLVALIRALDGTWHRPFTTLELAALQSLIDPDEVFDLDGTSDSAKRERIGNAVPSRAAQAIADLMGETLLLSWSGESFLLSDKAIWVRPVAVALSVRLPA
jgi:site-specific DNA-cytosine methylase